MMRTAIVAGCLMISLQSGAQDTSPRCFREGEAAYEAHDYGRAVTLFKTCVSEAPQESVFHHRLGRSYGRLAEESGWIEAVNLALSARKSFEKAIELDSENTAALADLMEFYEEAPVFLGGGAERAAQARENLRQLCDAPDTLVRDGCDELASK